jgi:hypothetical protein
VLDLPQLRVETRTVGRSFTAADGKTWRPSTFLTLGTALDSAKCPASLPGCTRGVDGLDPDEWTPRELRHSFVSLLSDHGLPLEEISRLVGHSSTSATEVVFRKQIRPVVELGAVAMNEIFAEIFADRSHSVDGVDTSSVL